MKFVANLSLVPATAVRADKQGDGTWKVYETLADLASVPAAEAINSAAAGAAEAQYYQDALSARQYGKLSALVAMTPSQIQAWVTANVTNLAQAQDAIATLATAVGVLARRL